MIGVSSTALCLASLFQIAASAAATPIASAKENANSTSVAKPAIAALNIRAVSGVSPEVAELLTEAVLSHLKNSGRFRSVLGRSDLEVILDHRQQKQALGCDQEACFTELGGVPGVPYLYVANLGRVGGQIVLNMKIIDVEGSEVLVRSTEVYPSESDLLERLVSAVDDLINSWFPSSLVDSKAGRPLAATTRSSAPIQKRTPAGAQSRKGKTKDKTRLYLGMSVSSVGLATVFGGYFHTVYAQRQLVAEQTVASFDTFERVQRRASVLAIVGWAVATTGILIWRSPE